MSNPGMNWIQPRGWFLDALFSNYRWYRRWCGGHWECWYIDVCRACIWMQMTACTVRNNLERPPCAFGSPICEENNTQEANV